MFWLESYSQSRHKPDWQVSHLKTARPYCRPKIWSSMNPLVYWRGWLLLTSHQRNKLKNWLLRKKCRMLILDYFRTTKLFIVSPCRPLYCIATYRKDRYKAYALWGHVYISDGARPWPRMIFWSDAALQLHVLYYGQNTLSPLSKWTHNRKITRWSVQNQIFYPDQEINWQVSVIMHRVLFYHYLH